MQSLKKSCFTLLELLIVLFIISFCMILTGVKIKEIYQEQRFLSEAQQVLSHIAMAQDLMMIMDTDVLVRIAPDEKPNQLNVWLEIDKPIEEHWARLVKRKLVLDAIQSMEFDEKNVTDLTLQFSFGQMSKGTLVLVEGKQDKGNYADKREFKIELLGYPAPLTNSSPKEKKKRTLEQRRDEKSERLYPVEVYEKLYQDPNEKDKS
jgi:type II secretory pathway pseudopilin PulG